LRDASSHSLTGGLLGDLRVELELHLAGILAIIAHCFDLCPWRARVVLKDTSKKCNVDSAELGIFFSVTLKDLPHAF
jgi:hypothetical protein